MTTQSRNACCSVPNTKPFAKVVTMVSPFSFYRSYHIWQIPLLILSSMSLSTILTSSSMNLTPGRPTGPAPTASEPLARLNSLKGQWHKIFDSFLNKKLHLGPIWTRKNGFAKFFVFAKILRKTCVHCPCSQRLCWHDVSVVVDYTDTASAWSLTTRTMDMVLV